MNEVLLPLYCDVDIQSGHVYTHYVSKPVL